MLYLDNGATSFHKPPEVVRAMFRTMGVCANPGRGGYPAAMAAARTVYRCRETAGELFGCQPEQVVFTPNCTQGLNMAIRTLVKPGDRVVVSGFEHNAVTRPLYACQAQMQVAGRNLFDWEDTLWTFEKVLKTRPAAAVITHVSNVFGYILPVEELAGLCRQYGVPLIVDAAQSAGSLPVNLKKWDAAFVAMPGHKGLLGPQGTGLLLCGEIPKPLCYGGTGSLSRLQAMPEELPERGEAGTLNVPGIAGLQAGMEYIRRVGLCKIGTREQREANRCAAGLERLGLQVYHGPHQAGTVSFVPDCGCEELADFMGSQGIALRAGLHCAPLAHESAGTLATGTVRVSFGHDAAPAQTGELLQALAKFTGKL